MSINEWNGDSVAVKQVHNFTFTDTWAAADIARLNCAGKSVTFTAAGATKSDVAVGLAAAWEASTEPALAEVAASSTSGGEVVHLTANTAGVSFLASSTGCTIAGDGTLTGPTTGTANSGPNCWGTATNWSLGTVPSSTDNVRIARSSVDILYDLDLDCAPDTLAIPKSFTGKLGLPERNANDYVDYRTTSLTFSSTGNETTIDVGKGEGAGSGRLKIDLATGATDNSQIINVYGTASRAESGVPSFLIKGSTDAELTINKGDVGLAFFAGETASVGTIKMGYVNNRGSDAKLRAGPGATLATITKNGGQLEINSSTTAGSLTQRAGRTTIGAGPHTLINIEDGTLYYNSTGAATTINVNGGGLLDYRQNSRAGDAPTAVNLYQGARLFDAGKTRAWSKNIDLVQCGFNDVTMDLGEGITISAT